MNFSVLVNFQDTDALQEEDISGLGPKTYPPFDGSFLTADRDVNRLESQFIQERGKRLLISKDGLCSLYRRVSDRVFDRAVRREHVRSPLSIERSEFTVHIPNDRFDLFRG